MPVYNYLAGTTIELLQRYGPKSIIIRLQQPLQLHEIRQLSRLWGLKVELALRKKVIQWETIDLLNRLGPAW